MQCVNTVCNQRSKRGKKEKGGGSDTGTALEVALSLKIFPVSLSLSLISISGRWWGLGEGSGCVCVGGEGPICPVWDTFRNQEPLSHPPWIFFFFFFNTLPQSEVIKHRGAQTMAALKSL